jgi:hypothetical protein
MKKLTTPLIAALCLATIFSACKRDTQQVTQNEIPESTLAQIHALGLSSQNVQKLPEGYLVEGDILLTDAELNSHPSSINMIIAQEEQYHTFNMVTSLPRTITVSTESGVSSAFSKAVDDAIARYNGENLQLSFQRVGSGGNINIRLVNTGQYIASSGFPSNTGQPYSDIKYAKRYANYSNGFMTTVIAHEMGHCIGFRHTDYMNRSFSCGIGGNEGQETTGVGAVYIPGTPTGPDPNSWMLACLSSTTNRPFNSNDKKALAYVY